MLYAYFSLVVNARYHVVMGCDLLPKDHWLYIIKQVHGKRAVNNLYACKYATFLSY